MPTPSAIVCLTGDVLSRIHAHIDHLIGSLSERLRSVNMSGRHYHCTWMPDLFLGDKMVDVAEQIPGLDLALVAIYIISKQGRRWSQGRMASGRGFLPDRAYPGLRLYRARGGVATTNTAILKTCSLQGCGFP